MRRPKASSERVTIKAVATRAGVSAMTVSNVVNRTGKASDATRARVLRAVDELGYVPSQAARRLVGSDTARIGLIYPDVDSAFVHAVIVAASKTAARLGLQLLMRGAAPDAADAGGPAAGALLRSGADALLLVPPLPEALSGTGLLGAHGVPAVAIATASALPDMDTVRIDNHSAARRITELLLAGGHRRIAVITGPANHSDSVARLEGHKAAISAHGLAYDPELCVDGDFTFGSALIAANLLLSREPRPTAIVAANDDMAAAVLFVAHRLGLDPPEGLEVTGFDDTLVATRVSPALTTVRQPIDAMLGMAAELLVERLRGWRRDDPACDIVFDAILVERGSTR